MGCDICKTAVVAPVIVISDEKHSLTSTTEQVETRDEPLQFPQSQVIHRTKSLTSTNTTDPRESVGLVVINHSNERNIFQSTPSNNSSGINSDQSTSLKSERDFRSTSSHSMEVFVRPKTGRTLVVESFLSDSTENDFPNETMIEPDDKEISHDGVVSSSTPTNVEQTILTRHTTSRFNDERATVIKDFSSDSDESYPLHKSFVTSSSESDITSINEKSDHRSLVTNMSKENIARGMIADGTDSSIQLQNSLSSDSEGTTVRKRVSNISQPPHPMKSDNCSNVFVYETSYESEIDAER
ncbi:unnamed protein product [Adineta ricciae]|uniref:Uncharacterized protein n=1 Tax=Adineta ricciae TaxID=249248 RepID=A0A813PD83_ADIRI|nr:unnamed protein product [Adineta ricciae]CAF0854756.1 unnamed protein product [Adineta ricciae]